ncbi:hypothetical protein QQF64_021940 [Cirrhinus molitorella]|uniref:Uncharacterized protein n=1 Tax=Cirrhinus molitorella TaxID=172907 RepID=A0ABR3LAD6_9TELE
MDQLTEELQAALDNLKSQTGKIHHCEEEIERFREKMDSHQKCKSVSSSAERSRYLSIILSLRYPRSLSVSNHSSSTAFSADGANHLMTYYPLHLLWTGPTDKPHMYTIYTNTHKQEVHLTLMMGYVMVAACMCVCVCVCGNDAMLAGLSVENSSFAVWEAFVVLCRQCCYACRNVSLRINVGILSSDRREREIDQSPPQSQPTLQPKRLDYQESFETSPFVHSMLVMISF